VKGVAKLEQVKRDAPPADKKIRQVENWGPNEWGEQVMAELVFAKVMNIQFVPQGDQLNANVAGFRVRCARNGLVLVPSDGDEDIFVAVRVERTKPGAGLACWAWLRGSEAKLFLSEELLGHSPRGLARYGKAPRQGTAPGNASIQEYRFER
jgi:hypothetical protein